MYNSEKCFKIWVYLYSYIVLQNVSSYWRLQQNQTENGTVFSLHLGLSYDAHCSHQDSSQIQGVQVTIETLIKETNRT